MYLPAFKKGDVIGIFTYICNRYWYSVSETVALCLHLHDTSFEVRHYGERSAPTLNYMFTDTMGILTESTMTTKVYMALNLEFHCDTLKDAPYHVSG